MTLRERQDSFIDNISLFPDWKERFDHFIARSSEQAHRHAPSYLLKYSIEFCQSRTCFIAYVKEGIIHIEGWSNSSVLAGIIVEISDMFNHVPVRELTPDAIDFHTRSGLIDNLTPLRKMGLLEIIRRIAVLSPQNT